MSSRKKRNANKTKRPAAAAPRATRTSPPPPRMKARGVFSARYDAASKAITINTASGPIASLSPFVEVTQLVDALRVERSTAGLFIAHMLEDLAVTSSEQPDRDRDVGCEFI